MGLKEAVMNKKGQFTHRKTRSHIHQAELSLNKRLIQHLGKSTLIPNPRNISSYHDADMRALQVRVKSFNIMHQERRNFLPVPSPQKIRKNCGYLAILKVLFHFPYQRKHNKDLL